MAYALSQPPKVSPTARWLSRSRWTTGASARFQTKRSHRPIDVRPCATRICSGQSCKVASTAASNNSRHAMGWAHGRTPHSCWNSTPSHRNGQLYDPITVPAHPSIQHHLGSLIATHFPEENRFVRLYSTDTGQNGFRMINARRTTLAYSGPGVSGFRPMFSTQLRPATYQHLKRRGLECFF